MLKLGVSVAVAALLLVSPASGSTEARTDWRVLGDLHLGMTRTAVEYERGPYNEMRGYRINGDSLILGFAKNRVNAIGTDSPTLKTRDGYGVGSQIPLGPCVKISSNPCARFWRGLMYRPRVLGGAWHAVLTYGKQKVGVLLRVQKGRVVWVSVQACPPSGWVRITDPGSGRIRCGLPL